MSKIEQRVIDQIRSRAEIGKNKYGKTMERNDLTLMQWIQHLQEEMLDAAVYIEKVKQELQYQEFELEVEQSMELPERDKINYPQARYHESEIEGDRNDRTTWENPGGSYWENQLDPDVAEHNHNVEREKQAQEEFAKEEAREERMKIIGQNGNDGLHYNEEDPLGLKWGRTTTLYPGDIKITHRK